MGVLGVPKAIYKAQQAKKKMSQIQAAGKEGMVGVLLNGLNDIEEDEIDRIELKSELENLGVKTTEDQVDKLADLLEKQIKKAFAAAKKNLEKELISSTSLEDLKGLLG
ncbi:MAG: hypothetical protein Q9M91_07875 [Candidatus Dojkabacteria bacterium]|nr:hypothetical protein [Candidatus Dojkabacteria bacterium]MDQ7021703.1 hypothetical protein [Candidatus Dojkabacteria bacterium]